VIEHQASLGIAHYSARAVRWFRYFVPRFDPSSAPILAAMTSRMVNALAAVLAAGIGAAGVTQAAPVHDLLVTRVMSLTRDSPWKLVSSTPIRFPTFHPQGMVKVGDVLYVSSVEVTTPTKRYPSPVDGFDRDQGAGIGHLFKLDLSGALLGQMTLGEGSIYHPGGIDYDGRSIWVPVAEYRPNSRSILYRVDPETMKATEILRVADHVGGLVHDVDAHALHGVSWGSRRFYKWLLGPDGLVTNPRAPLESITTINPSHYIDYQDCKYAGSHRMLCTGVAEFRPSPDTPVFRLGGIDLVSLEDGRPLHQVPVPLWTSGGLDMTHNPVWIEPSAAGLRAYFMPEDDRSTLYVYEVEAKQ
jgi:hypothetical protein